MEQYNEMATIITPKAGDGFIETPYINRLINRALDYLKCGFAVHLTGPTGVGKTTMALHIAAILSRPMVLICGDHEFGTSDLVGAVSGFRRKYTRDNFIRSVLKTEEVMTSQWVDNRLTVACKYGYTLVYDEFTRSRPEANNVFLSVLEGRILPLPRSNGKGEDYIKVHKDFAAIFTSNPEEYAGVFKSQDALKDRLVTIALDGFDEYTEIAITHAKSKISFEDAERIVQLVRSIRQLYPDKYLPSLRSCIKVAKILKLRGERASKNSNFFKDVCKDVLLNDVPKDDRGVVSELIEKSIESYN